MEQQNESSSQQSELDFDQHPSEELMKKFERKEVGPEVSRLLYYAMMDGAIDYREKFIDEDIGALNGYLTRSDDFMKARIGPDARNMSIKNVRKKFGEKIKKEKNRLRQITSMNKNEIDNFTIGLPTPEAKVKFKQTAAFLSESAEEILLAKDKQEILMLLKMYNNGDLDLLFTEYREQKAKANEKTDPSTPE